MELATFAFDAGPDSQACQGVTSSGQSAVLRAMRRISLHANIRDRLFSAAHYIPVLSASFMSLYV